MVKIEHNQGTFLAIAGTPVGDRPKQATRARQSWGQVERRAGGYSFRNPVGYADILEFGEYPGVGRRTVAYGDGIYSKQAKGGILYPVIKDESKIYQISELLIQAILRNLQKVGS